MMQRYSKVAFVAAIALFATLVAFGNITDYGSNFAFVQHVLLMDTIFPTATIRYRAIESPALHHAAYVIIIACEALVAVLCWIGAFRLLGRVRSPAREFNRAKGMAVAGLSLGFLLWQVGFMSIGGEWFGMWMSQEWNGVPSAFHFLATLILVLIYLAQRDVELDERTNERMTPGARKCRAHSKGQVPSEYRAPRSPEQDRHRTSPDARFRAPRAAKRRARQASGVAGRPASGLSAALPQSQAQQQGRPALEQQVDGQDQPQQPHAVAGPQGGDEYAGGQGDQAR